MKKIERILGIVGVSLFLLGTVFKMNHWPGTGFMLMIALVLINLGYLPLQLIRERREVSSLPARGYLVFRFITLFISLLAFFFKIQHWPGSGPMLFLSTFLIPLFILLYFYMRIKGKGKLPFQWSDLFIAILAYSIHIFITKSMVSTNVVNGYLILEEQYTRLNTGLMTANQLIYSSLDSAADSGGGRLYESVRELREISTSVLRETDQLRNGFISAINPNPLGSAFDLNTAPPSLLTNINEPYLYFLETPRGRELKEVLAGYLKRVDQFQKEHNLLSNLVNTSFNLEDETDPWGTTRTWEQHMFEAVPVASVFTTLSWIEEVVLLNERGIQNQLSRQLDVAESLRLLEELTTGESKLAMELKENEILRISQQKELQRIQLEKSQTELSQRNTLTALAFAGIVFVLILLAISTRAYFLKQKDNRELALQKDEISGKNLELSQRNEEILAQRDEIEAQRDEIEAQRDMVQKQKEQIENTHHEISSSIDYAMRLQDAMLPGPALLEEHFSDHMIFFRPKQKVSGDFYWWTRSGQWIIIAVADCTGHGVPGAFMSLLGASLLKEIVNREGITRPGTILDRMREEVIRSLNQKGSLGEQKDGMDMALVCIDPSTLQCQYAGANSPFYLLRRGRLTVYKPDLMPISFYEEMTPFGTTELKLQQDDQLYLFSDGYADQFGGESRRKFKYQNFRRLITEYADLSMPRQQQVFSDTIREWQGKHEQIDDMVIVGIRI